MNRTVAWEIVSGRFRFVLYDGISVVRVEQKFPPYFRAWKSLFHVTWFDKVCNSWLKFRQDNVVR